jgi:hypothetical protein
VDAARPNAKNAVMTDDAVVPILRNIQADLKADLTELKICVGGLDRRGDRATQRPAAGRSPRRCGQRSLVPFN